VGAEVAGKPTLLAEPAAARAGRFRSEAPLFRAVYGALRASGAVVLPAVDVSPRSPGLEGPASPWARMSPVLAIQSPAASLIYRKGLISEGDLLVDLRLSPHELFGPDVRVPSRGSAIEATRRRNALVWPVPVPHADLPDVNLLTSYAGRIAVRFSDRGGPSVVRDVRPYVDRTKGTVTSTNGQLQLDHARGVLIINAPAVQGFSGNLRAAGRLEFTDLIVDAPMEVAHLIVVSLDDQPLASSRKMLLQVMTEEESSGARRDKGPRLLREVEGTVRFKRSDATQFQTVALDPNGENPTPVMSGAEVRLLRSALYYLIEPTGKTGNR
jgi:hypothetical protein